MMFRRKAGEGTAKSSLAMDHLHVDRYGLHLANLGCLTLIQCHQTWVVVIRRRVEGEFGEFGLG